MIDPPIYATWLCAPEEVYDGSLAMCLSIRPFANANKGWQTIHYPAYKSYLSQVLWLIRNSAHGLVNGPLAARFNVISEIKYTGNPWLSKNNPEHVGQKFYATCGNYFQYMTVRKIPTINRAIFLNIGWQFDPFIEDSNTKNAYVAALKFSIKIGGKV